MCILHAIVCSKSWFYADSDQLKLNYKQYDQINSLVNELKDKKS